MRQWTEPEWNDAVASFGEVIQSVDSPRELGEVLRLDSMLELPFDVVVATYRRLFALGANDVLTKLCYARYLLLYDYEQDAASQILSEIEEAARAAGLWEGSLFAQHPVLLQPAPSRR